VEEAEPGLGSGDLLHLSGGVVRGMIIEHEHFQIDVAGRQSGFQHATDVGRFVASRDENGDAWLRQVRAGWGGWKRTTLIKKITAGVAAR